MSQITLEYTQLGMLIKYSSVFSWVVNAGNISEYVSSSSLSNCSEDINIF